MNCLANEYAKKAVQGSIEYMHHHELLPGTDQYCFCLLAMVMQQNYKSIWNFHIHCNSIHSKSMFSFYIWKSDSRSSWISEWTRWSRGSISNCSFPIHVKTSFRLGSISQMKIYNLGEGVFCSGKFVFNWRTQIICKN